MQNLKLCTARILNQQGKTAGTGFLIAPDLFVTCAHVVQKSGYKPGERLTVEFVLDQTTAKATVLNDGWSPRTTGDDIAFLALEQPHDNTAPAILGTAEERQTHRFISFGCAPVHDRLEHDAKGEIGHTIRVTNEREPLLRLEGDDVIKGMSGSPVLDTATDRVVGMITDYIDKNTFTRFAYATTTDTLARQHAAVKLWPDSHGPNEIEAYLAYLVANSKSLTLPGGARAPLERLYVSLRADQMMVAERQAEHDLYLDDVNAEIEAFEAQRGSELTPYERDAQYRRAYIRHRMKMFDARYWEMQIGERDRQTRHLAAVVQQHPHVVILGDPGTGKSTLCQWLVLQFARARLARLERVQVTADKVRPGEDAQTQFDLGPIRLPIFIRIATYARARWPDGAGTNGRDLSLLDFIGHQFDTHPDRPTTLTPACIGALCREALAANEALIILDGLDEVGDLDQRRHVMEAIRVLITAHAKTPVVLTSRIVGYQFQPLTDLPHYTIDAMEKKAIEAFCRAWMGYQQSDPQTMIDDADAEAADLVAAIFDHAHPGVRTLAGNPLLLTILADVYTRSNRTLPSRRVALFEKAARRLYEQREEQWDAADVTFIRLQRALGAVAVRIHAQSAAGYVEEGDVRAALRTVLADPEQIEAVLQAARDLSGFLIERGEGVYGFLHRSLQEYFAAVSMIANPDMLEKRIAERALDPTWREPVLLALGIIGSRRFTTAEQRRAAFQSVLMVPDPAATIMPRAALLLLAAVPECEQIPGQPLSQAVATLLDVLSDIERRQGAVFLRERIVTAFAVLTEQARLRETVESQLAESIGSNAYERRLAALSIVLQHAWLSGQIVQAVSAAWQRYAGPAVAMLLVLDKAAQDAPESLATVPLKLRDAVEREPELWQTMVRDRQWREVVRALFLRPGASWAVEYIQRDSPWTADIVDAVRRQQAPHATLGHSWRAALTATDDARMRDACLALAVCGDTMWTDLVSGKRSENSALLHAVFTTFLVLIARAHARALAFDLDLDLDHARARALVRDLDLDLDRALARALDRDRALELDRASDLARALDRALALDRDRAFARARARDLARVRALARALELDRARARARARALDLDHALARALDLDRALDLARARALDLARALALELDRALEEFNIEQELQELGSFLQKLQNQWSNDPEISAILIEAENYYRDFLDIADTFQISLMNGLRRLAEQFPHPNVPAKHDDPSFTLDKSADLVAALQSEDDEQRDDARAFLQADRAASDVGPAALSKMAELAQQFAAQPEVETQFEWALKRVHHDDPDMLAGWLVAAARQPEGSADRLLSTLHRVTPAFWSALLAHLPQEAGHVNATLLDAMSWIVRLRGIAGEPNAQHKSIPDEAYIGGLQHLLTWLANESDRDIRAKLLTALGYWPAPSGNAQQQAAFIELQESLTQRWQQHPAERALLAAPLARLARHDEAWLLLVRDWLETAVDIPAVAAGYARLLLYIYRPKGISQQAEEREKSIQEAVDAIVAQLQSQLMTPEACLHALIDAGSDDDVWDDAYHGLIARAVRILVSAPDADTLPQTLLQRCRDAHDNDKWEPRRMTLAALTACLEKMPTTLQRAATFDLERLLVAAARDSDSFTARRMALNALSYLHMITPAVVPALLAGCRDVTVVQNDAVTAAGRFTHITGDPVPALVTALTGGSLRMAYGAARVLGALGATLPERRPDIVAGLVAALEHPNAEREVVLLDEHYGKQAKGKLAETLYEALFRVAGWPT